jgi:signal transduction histidine kinase
MQSMLERSKQSSGTSAIVGNASRLAAVRSSALLDTPPELSFDRLTRLAARLTGAPVTFISLVDERRDFYKSCFGFPEPLATTREITGTTFCHYALSSHGPLVINDTLADPVYRNVPTVESLGVRAYLGVPMTIASGETIGSFCAIDFKPRAWSELDVEVMSELAVSTLREIDLRIALEEITRDRVRLHALAESNERLYKEASQANEEKDRFFASVTHELRTPMTSIIGWARVLASDVTDNPNAAEAVSMIESSARAQARLVDDLLDVSRIATGKIAIDRGLIDLNRVIDEAIRAAFPAATAKGVELRTSLSHLPAVFADASRARQIFDNLISNAIKFTPSGGSIEVLSEVSDGEIHVEVRDTGRGIAPEILPQIFDRGWQANSAEQGGLGLGLTIASYLARVHEGSITAKSEGIGKGATFVVSLPVHPAHG